MEGVTDIKRKDTYYNSIRNSSNGATVMTEAMSAVADVQSYDSRPNDVKAHADGHKDKSARVF